MQLFQYSYFYFVDKERQKEQIEVERSKIEENIDRLSKDIEKEEDVKQRKREVFIEDLDQQTEEKKAATEKRAVIDKAERFRGTNALASKLSKHLNLDEPVISVSYNLTYEKCISQCPSVMYELERKIKNTSKFFYHTF